jgi:hypothetical protein
LSSPRSCSHCQRSRGRDWHPAYPDGRSGRQGRSGCTRTPPRSCRTPPHRVGGGWKFGSHAAQTKTPKARRTRLMLVLAPWLTAPPCPRRLLRVQHPRSAAAALSPRRDARGHSDLCTTERLSRWRLRRQLRRDDEASRVFATGSGRCFRSACRVLRRLRRMGSVDRS